MQSVSSRDNADARECSYQASSDHKGHSSFRTSGSVPWQFCSPSVWDRDFLFRRLRPLKASSVPYGTPPSDLKRSSSSSALPHGEEQAAGLWQDKHQVSILAKVIGWIEVYSYLALPQFQDDLVRGLRCFCKFPRSDQLVSSTCWRISIRFPCPSQTYIREAG